MSMQTKEISDEENKKIEEAALSLKTAMKGAGMDWVKLFPILKIKLV